MAKTSSLQCPKRYQPELGVRDMRVEVLRSTAILPKSSMAVVKVVASQGDDRVGGVDGPESA